MSEKEEEYHDILKMHIKILKLLVLWPFEALSEKQNLYILRGHFIVGMILWIPPVLAATVYQVNLAKFLDKSSINYWDN